MGYNAAPTFPCLSFHAESVVDLLSHLSQFSAEHRAEAQSLHKEMLAFRKEAIDAFDEIWKKKPYDEDKDEEEAAIGSWGYRLQEEKRRRDYVISKISKPEVVDFKWRFTS